MSSGADVPRSGCSSQEVETGTSPRSESMSLPATRVSSERFHSANRKAVSRTRLWRLGTLVCTCCLVIVPYVGTVILLPLHVFVRSYSLCFLAQFGPDYAPFASMTGEAAPGTP